MTNIPNGALSHRRRPRTCPYDAHDPRLFTSVTVGLLVFLALLGTDWRMPTRILAAWDVCVGLYLVLGFHLASSADVHHIRRRARLQDEGQTMILVLTAVAALASLGAILALLSSGGSTGGSGRTPIQLAFATVTIVLSWAFTHTMFALHYAHEYYDRTAGGMAFPGEEREPDYWDFVYFSFVIGMTSQVSDVGVTSKEIRRTVTAHGVVAFVFNVALLALTINLAASAI